MRKRYQQSRPLPLRQGWQRPQHGSPWHREEVRHIGEEMPSRRTAPGRESKRQGARVERRWLNGAIVGRQNVLRPRAEGATATAYRKEVHYVRQKNPDWYDSVDITTLY